MKPSSLRSRLLLGAVSATALFLSSCVVADYPSVYASSGYHSVASVPTGLIRTSSSYWFYDPFRRSYYDSRRRAYYNNLTSRYYSTPPVRYNSKRYPSGWNGHGKLPLPHNLHNRNHLTHNTHNRHTNHNTRATHVNNNNSRVHNANHNQRANHNTRVTHVNNNQRSISQKPQTTYRTKASSSAYQSMRQRMAQSSVRTSSSNTRSSISRR